VPTKLTTDQMKQVVRQHFEDLVNQRIATVIPQNMTSDLYEHDERGGKLTDVAGDQRMMLAMYEKMPDLLLTIEDMIAEDDKVICRNVWRWTDPGSGQKMRLHGFVLWRFEGDRVAERLATVTSPAPDV
jgi:predicted ester cyclase